MAPLPSDASLVERYDAEHDAGKWQAIFDAAPQADRVRRSQRLTQLLGAGRSGRRVLDVGCGDGGFLDAAADDGWSTVGVEISWSAVHRASSRHLRAVATFEAIDACPHFDAVTFWDVLEHVPDPAEFVRQAVRRLRPGGLVALSMPNGRGTEALVQGASWRFHELAVFGHLLHAAPGPLRLMLRARGLDVVHEETLGSVDLRALVDNWRVGSSRRAAEWLLDKMSGVLARGAVPLGAGNTIEMVARVPAASSSPPGSWEGSWEGV